MWVMPLVPVCNVVFEAWELRQLWTEALGVPSRDFSPKMVLKAGRNLGIEDVVEDWE